MSKSKTPSQTRTVQTSSSVPEYARPFYEELMGRGAAELQRPIEETLYPGQRIAGFDPYQVAGQRGMADIAFGGMPEQMRMASDIASQIGYKPTNLGMSIAQGFDPQQIRSGYTAADIDPGYTPIERGSQFAGMPSQMGYSAGPFDPGYDPRALESQYAGMGAPGGAQFGPGFQPGTIADEETIQSYMNPYQRLVTDIEKREAQRQSDIQATGTAQQATQAGGLGGYREGIMQAERERNLLQQMGDIEHRGGQAAFQQAQQAFEMDRAARLQAGQLGLQTGQAREQALQQAETMRQGAYKAGEQARQQAAQFDMTAQQADDAARQAQEQYRQGAFAQTAEGRVQQEQFAQQAHQAGEQARQQAASLGLSAQQATEAGRQAANKFYMDAQQGNIASALQAAQLGMQGYGQDLDAQAQSMEAARLLGTLGGQERQMTNEALRNLQASGQIRQAQQQRGLTMGYEDFMRQLMYPREQLGFYSGILQGLPYTPTTTQTTAGGPSQAQQLLGAGIGGVGLYNALTGGRR